MEQIIQCISLFLTLSILMLASENNPCRKIWKKYFRKVLPTYSIVNRLIIKELNIKKVGNSLRTPIVILITFATNP